MTPQEMQKLLGGYATGTLTNAEQQALFAAALEDQELFDSLAREQSLRDLLRDPGAKAQLLAALDGRPAARWKWWPALAAAMAGAAAVAVLGVRMNVTQPARSAPMAQIARVEPPPAPAAPVPVGPMGVVPPPGTRAHKRMAAEAKPADLPQLAEARPAEAEKQQKAAAEEIKGGVVGGVVGGVPQAPAPQAQQQAVSTSQSVDGTLAAPAQPMFRAQGSLQQSDALSTVPSARALYFGNPNRRAPLALTRAAVAGNAGIQPVNAGIRYSILRKDAAGNFVEIGPADLKTGDTIELSLTANASGTLFVGSAAPVAVAAMTPHTTPPLSAGQPEVRVIFVRAQAVVQTGAQTAVQSFVAKEAAQPLTEVQGNATFVTSPSPSPSLSFAIHLQYK
jgi:hypothetical protein